MKNSQIVDNALCQIDLERCECFLKSDRNQIFDVIRNTEGGFDRFNSTVTKLLRIWINNAAKALVYDVSRGDETINDLLNLSKAAALFNSQVSDDY